MRNEPYPSILALFWHLETVESLEISVAVDGLSKINSKESFELGMALVSE